jgi:hypothetical protein
MHGLKSSAFFAKSYHFRPVASTGRVTVHICIYLSTIIMFLLRRTGPQPISRSIARAMSSSQQQSTVRFQFSAGEDEEQLGRDAAALVTEGQGRWKVTDDSRGLERTFRFKTFKATWVCEHSAFLDDRWKQ